LLIVLELGFGTFLLMIPPEPDALLTLIEDVATDVRERVTAARDDASSEPTAATADATRQ
jgi:hypothetical protein